MPAKTGRKSGRSKSKKAAKETNQKRGRKKKTAKATNNPATYPAARRIARLVADLPCNSTGVNVNEVCDHYVGPAESISEQTLNRYVKMLEEVVRTDNDQPVFYIEERGGENFLMRRPRRSQDIDPQLYELVSMYLSLEYLRLLEENIITPPIQELMEKMKKALPVKQRDLVEELPRKFFAAPSPHKDYSSEECADVLNDVIAAIVYQNELSIDYKPLYRDEPWWMRVYPLTLLYHHGSLYLIAIKKGYEGPVYYSIERIRETKVHRDAPFEYPDDYDPQQMLDGAFGIFGRQDQIKTFRLRFVPELKEYIMSWKVHETQQFEEQEDGSVILTMRVTDSEEVRSWIRSFGEYVEVLED